MAAKITLALAGNPNSGKTTIFNNLTGARQHVGNYPGVTVEKKEGKRVHRDTEITVVDLPGTYSLTAYSVEELVARDFLIEEMPDVVVDIVDASNLERNLYLAVQLIELGVPLVLALNMSDVAEARGVRFDLKELANFLGAPIVPTVGHKGKGMVALLDEALAVSRGARGVAPAHVRYGREIEEELGKVERALDAAGETSARVSTRWQALKLLEGDDRVASRIESADVKGIVAKSVAHLTGIFGESPETVIPDRRYGFISGACQEAVRATVEARHCRSDCIDRVLLSRLVGLPIFLGLMYLVFNLTFTVGAVPMEWLEAFFGWAGGVIGGLWPAGVESPLRSLLVDGVVGGVGGVVVFLPNIILLFFAIAVLEDSGYMARAAFLMDHLMHRIGLHGKSFIPMLIGFGCSVPAIMAARTLENRRDRLTTIMVTPLMSCGARLPIYALIIPAFFPRPWHGPLLWLIYVIGIALAVLSAKLLRMTVLSGETTPFVMELPPYRMPTLEGVLIHTWERAWQYLRKAATIILGLSILLWGMTAYPRKPGPDARYVAREAAARRSYETGLTELGRFLAPGLSVARLEQALAGPVVEGEAPAAADDDGDAAGLRRFRRIRAGIERVRRDYRDACAAGDIAAGSLEQVTLAAHRDSALAALETSAPEMYRAASRYLDQVYAPYKRELMALETAQRADALAYSAAGRLGHFLEPILRPLGFDWRIGTALVGALAAKEMFVAQLGIVFAVGGGVGESGALRAQLQRAYSPLVGFCIMIFCLITAPCVATIVVTWRETGSWKWALLQLGGLTVLAYLVTGVIYQAGAFFGWGV